MDAAEIIEYLREQNFTVETDGDCLELSPPEKITEELIQRLRKHKPAIIAELRREERRARVLQMLDDRPEIQRAFVTDSESDPDNVILAMAVRGVGTCELLIERQKYDPFLLLELIQKGSVQ